MARISPGDTGPNYQCLRKVNDQVNQLGVNDRQPDLLTFFNRKSKPIKDFLSVAMDDRKIEKSSSSTNMDDKNIKATTIPSKDID